MMSLGNGNIQFFGGSKTLYELKQNLSTVGQQLQKTEGELSQKAIDPSASMEDLQALQKTKDDLKMRFDLIKEQHDSIEAEQKAKFNQTQIDQQRAGFDGLDQEQKMVKAKAEFIRAAIQGRPMNDEAKQLIALPTGNDTGGDNFLPTTMTNTLVHEPFAKNPLRTVAKTTAIKGLELPRISHTIDDDDFVTDEETAKELKLKGDTVSFGRHKFKVKASISDTVIHGSDIELTGYVDNALRSGLAGKERKDAFSASPSEALKHMSFYNGDIKEVEGADLYEAITSAVDDLPEDYRDNVKVMMRRTDYTKMIKTLANGNATLYGAQPEEVLGFPVEFADGAVDPIVGDFEYFGINYDGIVFDSDKDVNTGNYLFVLTAWYDQQRTLNSAFRIAKVKEGATP